MNSDVYFYDVLKTFAEGMGVYVTSDRKKVKEKTMASPRRSDLGFFSVPSQEADDRTPVIFVQEGNNKYLMANVLLHELSHMYAWLVDVVTPCNALNEIVAEASAWFCMQLCNFPYVLKKSTAYIQQFGQEYESGVKLADIEITDALVMGRIISRQLVHDLTLFMEDAVPKHVF